MNETRRVSSGWARNDGLNKNEIVSRVPFFFFRFRSVFRASSFIQDAQGLPFDVAAAESATGVPLCQKTRVMALMDACGVHVCPTNRIPSKASALALEQVNRDSKGIATATHVPASAAETKQSICSQ